MRRVALLILTALLLCGDRAYAQDGQNWTDRSGRISLAFSALGWSELELPPGDRGTLLGIEHRLFQESGRMRTCFISERRQSVPADGRLTQENLNAVTAALGPSGLQRVIGSAPNRSDVITLDGVSVIDAVFEAPTRMYMRVFYLKDGQDMVQIVINCGASMPVESEVESNITRLLQTLRIHPESDRS